jgi:type VI secretion system protein ImpH
MAHPDRSATFALILRLMERPHAFDFFTAVRRIEAVMGDGGPMLGATTRLRQDPVRFSQGASLAFEPSTIKSFSPGAGRARHGDEGGGGGAVGVREEAAGPGRLEVAFMGLLGANGPLPLHLTEYARDRVRDAKDTTLLRFLDIFHHRSISLFYRAWAMNRPAVLRDRAARGNELADRYGYYLSCLTGIGAPSLRGRDAVPDRAKWYFAGRLSNQTRPPESIEDVVVEDFGVTCEVVEFVGRWMDLPGDARLRLGESAETGALGVSTIIGTRHWDCQQTFRLRLGPMSREKYERFLPGTAGFRRLTSWVRQHIGLELMWEAQLVLKKEEATGTRLGAAPSEGGARLGWTSWIMSDPLPEDPDQLILRGPEEADLSVVALG